MGRGAPRGPGTGDAGLSPAGAAPLPHGDRDSLPGRGEGVAHRPRVEGRPDPRREGAGSGPAASFWRPTATACGAVDTAGRGSGGSASASTAGPASSRAPRAARSTGRRQRQHRAASACVTRFRQSRFGRRPGPPPEDPRAQALCPRCRGSHDKRSGVTQDLRSSSRSSGSRSSGSITSPTTNTKASSTSSSSACRWVPRTFTAGVAPGALGGRQGPEDASCLLPKKRVCRERPGDFVSRGPAAVRRCARRGEPGDGSPRPGPGGTWAACSGCGRGS